MYSAIFIFAIMILYAFMLFQLSNNQNKMNNKLLTAIIDIKKTDKENKKIEYFENNKKHKCQEHSKKILYKKQPKQILYKKQPKRIIYEKQPKRIIYKQPKKILYRKNNKIEGYSPNFARYSNQVIYRQYPQKNIYL